VYFGKIHNLFFEKESTGNRKLVVMVYGKAFGE